MTREPANGPAASARPVKPDLRPAGPIVRAVDLGIWAEAGAAVQGAERYAERTREWARAAYRRAKDQGHAEGRAAGLEAGSRFAAQAEAELSRLLGEIEGQLPRLVMELVESMLGAFDPGELLPHAVREAVARLNEAGDVQLRVAPPLVDAMRAVAAELEQTGRRVRIEPDPGLGQDGCILSSAFGNVELSMGAQLAALRESLAVRAIGHGGSAA